MNKFTKFFSYLSAALIFPAFIFSPALAMKEGIFYFDEELEEKSFMKPYQDEFEISFYLYQNDSLENKKGEFLNKFYSLAPVFGKASAENKERSLKKWRSEVFEFIQMLERHMIDNPTAITYSKIIYFYLDIVKELSPHHIPNFLRDKYKAIFDPANREIKCDPKTLRVVFNPTGEGTLFCSYVNEKSEHPIIFARL